MTTADLYTFKEAAEALGVTTWTLQRWTREGTAPKSAIIGRRRYWRVADVNEWITARFDGPPTTE